MLVVWLLSLPLLVIAILVYRRMGQSSMVARLLVASAIWLLAPVAVTVWVLSLGDPPPSDAITIVPATATPR